MKKWLSLLTAGLLLYPFAAVALDYGSQFSQVQEVPPVAQTLVREGDFAIKLAAELGLGNPTDEASAEDVLATAGVLPSNGWISDYPMTPEIVGQLQESIARAAEEGKLPMNADAATRGLYTLTSQMNLPTPAGSGAMPADAKKAPADKTSPTVINNYYYDQGPPIVTYYPPPADYMYLYAWVPFPTFWFGFWFPGFFICHNFTTVVVTRPVFVNQGFIMQRRVVVSNRFIDPVTRRVAVVDPVARTASGGVHPRTVLRTESGRTFNSTMELRQDAFGNRTDPVQRGGFSTGPARNEGFRTPESRRSAGNIFSRSVEGMNVRRERGDGGVVRGNERSSVAPNAPERSFRPSLRRGDTEPIRPQIMQRAPDRGRGGGGSSGNPFIAPRTQERSFQPSGRSGYSGRFTRQGMTERSVSGVTRGNGSRSILPNTSAPSSSDMLRREGGSGSSRSFSGNGWRGR
jgi:hypothetical protein